ncbi:MAG: hypothetical protein ACTTKH_01320 [Treponema sp.]
MRGFNFSKIFFFAVAIIFVGCVADKDDVPKAQIEFWSFPNFTSESGTEGDFEKSLIKAFETQYPSI